MTRRNAYQKLWNTIVLVAIAFCIVLYTIKSVKAEDDLDSITTQATKQYDTPQALDQAFSEAQRFESQGKNYQAASVFFNVYTADSKYRTSALGKTAENLIKAGFPNAAAYFYIKTLQSGDNTAIRGVLKHLPRMLESVGGDLLRNYILRFTKEDDYDANVRNHFFYYLGKDELLKGNSEKALSALGKVTSGSGILSQALYLKGTAYAILGQKQNALKAFESCRSIADKADGRTKHQSRELDDLEARCQAGLARIHYELGQYETAEEIYDDISKATFVWTDILFEQAWNSFAKGDVNRTLGKLVTYRSPSLEFVFNPEIEVLKAQAFLSLCLFEDVNKSVNEFNSKYADIGSKMKSFLQSNDQNLGAFYQAGRNAFYAKLHTSNVFNRALNRSVRGPYFASLVVQEKQTKKERARISAAKPSEKSFGGFLEKVLSWREKSIGLVGGAFVKNSMVDLYQDVLANFDKISFIKLEMLNQSKLRLERKQALTEDEDGVLKKGEDTVERRDYQLFWKFNGEFWIDELGDYVFALKSECSN